MAIANYEFHPEARAELLDAGRWYRAENPGAARDFLWRVRAAVQDICESPDRYTAYLYGTRKFLLTPKFPYLVVYRERLGSVQIIAVAHGARRPGYWRHRVR